MRVLLWWVGVAVLALSNLASARGDGRPPPPRGDPSASRADSVRYQRLDSLLDTRQYSAARTLATALKRHAEASDTLHIVRLDLAEGRIALATGDPGTACARYRSAARLAAAARDTTAWMTGLRYQAYSCGQVGPLEESTNCYRTLLALARTRGSADFEGWGRLGLAYGDLLNGDMEHARSGYASAIRLFRRADDSGGELVSLVGLGRVYQTGGDVDSARACYQRVWVEARAAHDTTQAANALNNLGAIEHDFGDVSLAVRYYRRAYELQHAAGNTAGAVLVASNLALARSQLGQYDEAAAILGQALAVCNAKGLRGRAGIMLTQLGFARTACDRNRAAVRAFRAALAMGDTLAETDRVDAAWGLLDVTAVLDSVDAGIDALREELVEARGASFESRVLARSELARCLAYFHDAKQGLREARDAEREARGHAPGAIRAAALFAASYCFRRSGEPDSALACLRAGEVEIDRAITAGRLGAVARSDVALPEAGEILLEFPPTRSVSDRCRAFFDLLERYRSAIALADRIEPHERPRMTPASPVTARMLQHRVLQPGDLLLDFLVRSRETYLLAVSRDTVACAILPGRYSSLAHRVHDYCTALATRPGPGGISTADLADAQLSLGREILGPVAGLMHRADRVIVVPSGFLHPLAFLTLALPDSSGRPIPLLERAAFYRVASAAELVAADSTGNALASSGAGGTFLVVSGGGPSRGALAGARDEVHAIRARYAGVTEYDGPLAARALCERMQSARIIHLAGHVDVNDQAPRYSGILVGAAATNPAATTRSVTPDGLAILSEEDSVRFARAFPHDPYLRAYQVAKLSLHARLAVLSGCRSALGHVTLGAGVIGLSSGFIDAGVPAVIGSLWPVDDRVTATLMGRFYDGLADGLTVSEALRRAELDVRRNPATAHPFYWAGFVVAGNGGERVSLQRTSEALPAAVGGTVLLVLLATAAIGYRARSRNKKVTRHA